jgi:hypothetical protein
LSKISLSGNASGTGTFTIASPNSNTDRTLTLPDQTATLITNSSDVLNIGSGQVYKDASGNVGIGTASPGAKLDVRALSGGVMFNLEESDSGNNRRVRISNSGTVNTIESTAGSGNTQLAIAVDGMVRGRFDNSGNFQFNSGYGSVAPAYGCRAWVNFNGTGTVAIRASGNVTSITDNGVGSYTVNFTTAMPDTNYAITVSSAITSNYPIYGLGTPVAGAVSIALANQTASAQTAADSSSVYVAIFR